MRRTAVISLIGLFLVSLPAASAAQESGGVFAPYVSRLRIGVKDELIVLSWEDSPDSSGPLLIYRAQSPITSSNLPSATLVGKVPYGQGRFEDRPGPQSEWYYAILSLDESGAPYEFFLPFRNATAVGVRPESPSVASLPTEAEGFVDARFLTANVESDAVVLKFGVSPSGHRLVFYRSPDPISSSLSVLSASIVSIVDDTVNEVRDYPVPGIGYYYAVIDEKRLKEGGVYIQPGANATLTPAKVEAGAFRIGLPEVSPLSRSIPLPYRIIDNAIGSGERLGTAYETPSSDPAGPDVEKAIDRILKLIPARKADAPSLVLVERDAAGSATGEDYTLASIVSECIVKSDWNNAISQLEKFLSIRRAETTERRARFYLGQAYAMNGKYRDALFSLLVAQERYYLETREWIAYCLDELRSGRDS
jgi:hypothetical protein